MFSRMRSRRVPVLRLGSRGPGGDARSLRLCSQSVRKRSQSSASVRNRSRRVAHAGEAKIVAKRRTVVTFYVLHYKNVNSHRDRGGRGRETQAVVTFGHVSALRVSKALTVTGIGGVVVAKPRTVVTFGLASGERKGERRDEKR